ncbi:MAG: hypothetical protein OEX08_02620 [Candidatus Nomurabacteria bacterium]|nr:hypothetical protein [Candidatus Nomurabacteria bacterium]
MEYEKLNKISLSNKKDLSRIIKAGLKTLGYTLDDNVEIKLDIPCDFNITILSKNIRDVGGASVEAEFIIRKLLTPIEGIGLSVRAINGLRANKVALVVDFFSYDDKEFLKFRNLGKKTLAEINKVILSHFESENGVFLKIKSNFVKSWGKFNKLYDNPVFQDPRFTNIHTNVCSLLEIDSFPFADAETKYLNIYEISTLGHIHWGWSNVDEVGILEKMGILIQKEKFNSITDQLRGEMKKFISLYEEIRARWIVINYII